MLFLGLEGSGGGTPRGVWGPRLADSSDPGPPGPVRGDPPPKGGLGLLKREKSFFALLSSNPYRVREAKCLFGALAFRRAAGPQPDSNPFQLRLTVKRTFSAKLRGEAESKKTPLEGGGGVNPKP